MAEQNQCTYKTCEQNGVLRCSNGSTSSNGSSGSTGGTNNNYNNAKKIKNRAPRTASKYKSMQIGSYKNYYECLSDDDGDNKHTDDKQCLRMKPATSTMHKMNWAVKWKSGKSVETKSNALIENKILVVK